MTIRDGDLDITDSPEFDNDMKEVYEGRWSKKEDNEFSVQTRSEENGLRNFPTLKAAIEHARKDDTVWKISFALPTGERVRMVQQAAETGVEWVYENLMSDDNQVIKSLGQIATEDAALSHMDDVDRDYYDYIDYDDHMADLQDDIFYEDLHSPEDEVEDY